MQLEILAEKSPKTTQKGEVIFTSWGSMPDLNFANANETQPVSASFVLPVHKSRME